MRLRAKAFIPVVGLCLAAIPAGAEPEVRRALDESISASPSLPAEVDRRPDPIGALIEQQKFPPAPKLTAADLIAKSNGPGLFPLPVPAGEQNPMILKLQVMLDRAHASPGVIDGYNGDNVAKAVAAVETMLGLPVDGLVDRQVWTTLELTHPVPPLIEYVISEKDVAGPFVPEMPKDYAEMAKLEWLAYRDPVERLAEKFHMDENLLKQLNPGVNFSEAGATITVANVAGAASTKVVKLVADKGRKQLFGYDSAETLVVSYPATIGSSDLPSPDGTHLVKTIATDPEYWYRPKVNFQQGNNTQALKLAPGPNNPVGSAWIGLDKPTYGIHGTPAPNKIDKTSSHGCIRLTNWDVRELAKLVQPGAVVEFLERSDPETVGSIARR